VADEGYQPFPDISAWTAVPFDPTTYDQYAALLEQARAEATEEAREHAVKTAMRYAGTDTGAIEGLYTTDRGFTRTVAIEAAGWEAAANERGPNAAAIIKDQIEAYEWVLDLVAESRPVTEHVIRELHVMLCRSQDTYVVHTEVGPQEQPLPKGQYKTLPNNPTSLATGQIHHYAPPDMVAPEMARLVASLSSESYLAAHPVVQAAYLHYSFVAIHPFADGNGRVSRALASVPLYRALRVPFMLLREDRDEYLDCLAAADSGDLRRFVSFVVERVIETVDLAVLTVRAGAQADQAGSLARLRDLVTGVGGLSHDQLDAVANRLLDAVHSEVSEQVAALSLPVGVSLTVDVRQGRFDAPGYRSSVADPRIVQINAESHPPAGARRAIRIVTLIATDDDCPAFLVAGMGRRAEFAVRDVEPTLRTVARVKISALVTEIIAAALEALTEAAEDTLRKSGYLG